LPIEARFRGTTYGIGTSLAAGWNGWFVTLPFNWTYADMQSSDTDGASFTATPRVGRLINLGRRGNLALFVGGNYLDTDLTVDGLATAPGGQFTFDYIVDQRKQRQIERPGWFQLGYYPPTVMVGRIRRVHRFPRRIYFLTGLAFLTGATK
jgi:hypothetical protein